MIFENNSGLFHSIVNLFVVRQSSFTNPLTEYSNKINKFTLIREKTKLFFLLLYHCDG